MSSEIVPPHPGMSRPEDSPAAIPAHEATTPEEPPPATPATDAIPAPTGSSSADELDLSLDQISPDPLLEESEQFVGLDLSAPLPSKAGSASVRGKVQDGEDEDADLPPRGSSWPMALLISYASAVTIGLIWVLWGHRLPRERETVEADPFPPAETAPDPGHRANQSRKLLPPPPLPADRIVTLGQTVRLGSLELTPLEVKAGSVTLLRQINRAQARQGGEAALSLKLRLKNVSIDSILVPLDEAFLRERGREVRDSFIETGPTGQIAMFPLAVVSEWSIVGQEFRELGPGESYETRVVSAPDALAHLVPEMTWRIRFRTDVNQTETLGVRFRQEDVRKEIGRVDEEL